MSTTPPPKKTFRSRVGTVMRRSSTSWNLPGLPNRSGSTTPPLQEPDSASMAGSTSPKLEREGSTTSLTQVDTTRSTPPPPSTIPESPAREEAALASEMSPQQVSSPLSGGVVTAEPASDPSLQAPEESRKAAKAPKAEPAFVIPSVVVNSPEPAKEEALAPVFTAEPEEMSPAPPAERTQVSAPPASTKASDAAPTPTPPPSTPPPPAREPTPPSAPAREPTPPSAPARKPTPPVSAATPPPAGKVADDPSTAPQIPASSSAPVPTAAPAPSRTRASTPLASPPEISHVPSSAPRTPPAQTPPVRTPPAQTPGPATTTGYFDLAVPRTSSPLDEHVDEGANVWADHISTSPPPQPAPAPAPAPAPSLEFDPLANRPAAPKVAKTTSRPRGSSISSAQVMAQRQPSRKPSSTLQPREREIVGTTYTWSNPSSEFNQSKASLTMPSEDPFADRAPSHHIYPPQQPAEISSPIVHDVFDPRSPRDDSMIAPVEPVAVPLPALHEVMLTHSVRQVSSGYTSSDGASTGYFQSRDIPIETNERRPLITRPGRPSTPPIVTTFSQPSPSPESYHSHTFGVSHPTPQRAQPARLEGNGSAHTYSYGSVSRPYASRGWIEQALPHGGKYFVNPRIQATTDVDLRNLSKLDAVMSVVETAGSAPEGCEMWAREGPVVKRGWRRQKMAGGPVISWVDHRIRRVSSGIPSVDGIIFSGEDDRLDDEFRYWSFVETHPAHISLPPSARQEALDALHWSYTDPLLAHPQPIPPPFTQEECHKLLGHLNDPNMRSTTTHTRMIARILLRVAHWRQTNFRPHKPLPRDVPVMQRPKRRVPVGRMIADILTGILCLGIPFFLVDRSDYGGHLDLEGNIVSNSGGPLFLAGACACLVAAVILSASVTLMTLPGLSGIARMSGLVAIMCSVLSMITSFISIIRHKAEMAHGAPTSGSEGFVLLTRRSVFLSLPLVFLAYSVAGFITGVVIYSFNGVVLNGTANSSLSHVH
ncbi:uncharacterized protein BJ212DRAFT_757624 [Suillus subaureus]|uniref:Uncharacterized protein n=1 Tax=Suillus subaureus TaxID=48587 RepID=A0A9P7DZP1_9AGAM|nr:uncharacterized protein BJ212DRAFT_757624 [Suillus subaureus]KAG1807296.1 hypothetical protein BJ212DRAFT_757624 [Suillus subaureus]